MMKNSRGSILTFFLIMLGLVAFFFAMVGFFSYKAGLLRVEFGKQKTPQEEHVVDENTIKEVQKKGELLAKREEDVKKQEAVLRKLQEQLQIERQKIFVDQQNIKKSLSEVSTLFEKFSDEKEQDMKRLAQLYESMKPDSVALIFQELDVNTVAELLMRIKSRNSAKILASVAKLDASRAADISRIMEGQNKSEAFAKTVK